MSPRSSRAPQPQPGDVRLPGWCCPGSPTPLARLPPGAARPHPRRRRHLLDLARADVRAWPPGSTPTPTSRWPGPTTPRWRWPGSPASGSSTTCTTAPAAPRTPTRTRWREALRRPPPDAGHPAHPARHLLPRRRARRPSGHRVLDAVQRVRRRPTRDAGPSACRALQRGRRPARRRGDPLGARGARRRSWPTSPRAAAGRPLHVHLSEQPAENDACLRATTAARPTELLAEPGVLGPRTTAVHATHLTDDDIALLGGTGTTVCLCPTTERDLADGIGPARALRRRGLPAVPRLATSTPSSTCSRRRGRWRCTSGSPPASAAGSRPRSCSTRSPRTGTPRSAGPTPAGSASGAPADLVAVAARHACAPPGRAPARLVLRGHGRRRRHGRGRRPRRGRRERAGTCSATSAALLADAIAPLWEELT